MRELEFAIEINLPGWPAQESDRKIADAIVALWTQMDENLSEFSFSTERGDIKVRIDWLPAIAVVQKEYLEFCNHEIPKGDNSWSGYIKGICQTTFNIEQNNMKRHLSNHVENIFYHLFLILNLSAPSSFDLYNCKLSFPGIEGRCFKLDSSYFFGGWIAAINNEWPRIEAIPLLKSVEWFEKLNIGTKQIARTRTERALVALLNVSDEPKMGPADLVWLAHCLETLFDTPASGISKILKERIFLILEEPSKNNKVIKKSLNMFYELRSRFVHGDLEIYSPCQNEILDRNLDSYIEELDTSITFAMSIIISMMQSLILNEWTEVQFFETFSGVKNSSI